MATYLSIAAVAYLLGSIPFGYILVRVFRGTDVRQAGSGNIGATNVARSSPILGLATLVLDAGKGWLAVEAATILAGRLWAQGAEFYAHYYDLRALAAATVVAGHMFPIWLKFRGGKGVATGAGAFLALAPRTLLMVLGIFVIIVAALRYVSLGSILAAAAFPVLLYLLGAYHSSAALLAAAIGTAALIIAKHHENIRRLLAGTENRLQFKRG